MRLNLLCAGALKGLVQALGASFERETGATLSARFGAVGAMRDALRAGEPCELFITTEKMAETLVASGELRAASQRAIGSVRTGLAVVAGAPRPDVGDADALNAALSAASALYFPDGRLSTAGAHFMSVIDRLGMRTHLADRLRMFPNGAAAMAALAASADAHAIGCTQVTEIRYTPGLDGIGFLPAEYELATVYVATLAAGAGEGAAASRFADLLCGEASEALRSAGGFDPASSG